MFQVKKGNFWLFVGEMSTDADGGGDGGGVPTTLPPQPTSPLLPRAGKISRSGEPLTLINTVVWQKQFGLNQRLFQTWSTMETYTTYDILILGTLCNLEANMENNATKQGTWNATQVFKMEQMWNMMQSLLTNTRSHQYIVLNWLAVN